MTTTYTIARRAYGSYTPVETVEGFVPATLRALELQATNRDGEYLTYRDGEVIGWTPGSSYQSPMDWL